MLDFSHIPTGYGSNDIQIFTGANSSGGNWQVWQKPRGKTVIDIFLLGAGGNGGNGAVGVLGAASGGGGGSGAQTRVRMPLALLPDVLYVMLNGAGAASRVSIIQDVANNVTVAVANGGTNGGDASGSTGGTQGLAGGGSAGSVMIIGANGMLNLAGQNGAAGVSAASGVSVTLPTTGLHTTGGASGGGTGGTLGNPGGQATGAGLIISSLAGQGSQSQSTPPFDGGHAVDGFKNYGMFLGGGGGGSTGDAPTGAGLIGGNGGNATYGGGGGGGGGALTGSVQGLGGAGGPALCIITCW